MKRKNKVELLKIKKSEDGKIEPIELLKKLGERGLQELLIEGGTNTARRFVESNLIDRILMFRSPISFKDPVKGLTGHEIVGLGLERLILFSTGMSNIRDVIPFPRTPKNASF